MTPFKLKQTIAADDGIQAVMTLDSQSVIYQAHFPGHPVTPGACLIQTVSDLMELHHNRKLSIREMKNVRFLSAIIPGDNDEIVFDIRCTYLTDANNQNTDAEILCKATVSKKGALCAKMSLVFY